MWMTLKFGEEGCSYGSSGLTSTGRYQEFLVKILIRFPSCIQAQMAQRSGWFCMSAPSFPFPWWNPRASSFVLVEYCLLDKCSGKWSYCWPLWLNSGTSAKICSSQLWREAWWKFWRPAGFGAITYCWRNSGGWFAMDFFLEAVLFTTNVHFSAWHRHSYVQSCSLVFVLGKERRTGCCKACECRSRPGLYAP